MQFRRFFIRLFLAFTFCTSFGAVAYAQASGSLRGEVLDPTGAVVPGATVSITGNGLTRTAVSDGRGSYEIDGVAPGSYTVDASATGFAEYAQPEVTVAAGQIRQMNLTLEIAVEKEEVQVEDDAPNVDTSPADNASAIVIKGKDLDALSDDPDEMQSELEALAGPSAGPDGGQIYIDGFTGGQLPPKSAIREIRINQNPFSAEYDKLGYGRIEILTKPGSDQLHGQAFFNINNSVLNTNNPFASQEPGYQSEMFNVSVGGPINKNASYFFTAQRRNISDDSIINAYTLDQAFNPTRFSDAVLNPRVRTNISPRIDYQLGQNNTLTVRYQFVDDNETNDGIGQLSLVSQAYNVHSTEHTLQVTDTQVISSHTINETRFQFIRSINNQTPQSTDPTISVLGAFTGGGSAMGAVSDRVNRYELQNTTSMSLGHHVFKFGGRLRAWHEVDDATANFNGTFTFSSLAAYQTTQLGLQQGWTAQQIAAAGGGPSQFSIITGQPTASVTLVDAGLFAQDDWQVRPNLTLSAGLRFETQNDISDHADFAPRFSLAWAPGHSKGAPKTVVRAGFGIFYDRFAQDLVLNADRLDGTTEQQYIVTDPTFYPNIPGTADLTGALSLPTVYRIANNLRVPYVMQSAVSLERQVTKSAKVSLTYLNSRGVHQLLSENINAPLPGTYNPLDPAAAIRPLGNIGNVYEYVSQGVFRQNQLIANFNIRTGPRLSLFGYYALNYANSDTAGASSFPSNPYDLALDYGRASFDVRHRLFLAGTIGLNHGFSISPFVLVTSGQPFNITIGQDLNGDSIFNDRPAFATNLSSPTVVQTPWGAFDMAPQPGETIIPPNYGTGPGQFTANLRLSKTFSFGKKTEADSGTPQDGAPHGGGGPHGHGGPVGGFGGRGVGGPGGPFGGANTSGGRYSVTFSVFARNLFNRVNLAPPIGNLNSPLFGQSIALAGGPFGTSAANRRVDFQIIFSF
jgi:hypothetical protein